MFLTDKAFGVDFVDVFGAGGAGGEPACAATTFRPPMAAPLPGARGQLRL